MAFMRLKEEDFVQFVFQTQSDFTINIPKLEVHGFYPIVKIRYDDNNCNFMQHIYSVFRNVYSYY